MPTANQIIKIQAEVEQAATRHLNATDAETALSHYTDDAFAVSNTTIFSSLESLSEEVCEYYKILKKVNYASWEDVNIHVINESAASFTAKFRYGFTDKKGVKTDLRGVWTALFVRDHGDWKIRLRHESFEQI